MKMRRLATCVCGVVLLATGTTLLSAQNPPSSPDRAGGRARAEREKLRAEIVRLQTEIEMHRFDYELAREVLLEELKTSRGLKMATGLMGLGFAIQSAVNDAGNPPAAEKSPAEVAAAQKKAETEAKKAEEEQKRGEAEEAKSIADAKKNLSRLFALMAEKRLDLEDAERRYHELPH